VEAPKLATLDPTRVAGSASAWHQQRIRGAALPYELPAILLMEGAGLRNAEILACRWADLDLARGRARVFRKGHNWHWLPPDPDIACELRASSRVLRPDPKDHVFTVEI